MHLSLFGPYQLVGFARSGVQVGTTAKHSSIVNVEADGAVQIRILIFLMAHISAFWYHVPTFKT